MKKMLDISNLTPRSIHIHAVLALAVLSLGTPGSLDLDIGSDDSPRDEIVEIENGPRDLVKSSIADAHYRLS